MYIFRNHDGSLSEAPDDFDPATPDFSRLETVDEILCVNKILVKQIRLVVKTPEERKSVPSTPPAAPEVPAAPQSEPLPAATPESVPAPQADPTANAAPVATPENSAPEARKHGRKRA